MEKLIVSKNQMRSIVSSSFKFNRYSVLSGSSIFFSKSAIVCKNRNNYLDALMVKF